MIEMSNKCAICLKVIPSGYMLCDDCPSENASLVAQLRTELEMNKANLESFMQLQSEHKKLCDLVAKRYEIYLKDQAEMVRLRAELDEARKVILHTFQEHEGCNFAEDWLSAHPEETK